MTDFYDYDDGSRGYSLMIRDTGIGAAQYWYSTTDPTNAQWGLVFKITSQWGVYQTAPIDVPWSSTTVWTHIYDMTLTVSQFTTLEFYNPNNPPPPGQIPGGFPQHDFTIHVVRPTVPDPPGAPTVYSPTVNSLRVSWSPPYDGGAAITDYQIGYGTDSSGPTSIVYAGSGTMLGNLATGTTYYFWVRARNSVGWSDWSYPTSGRTYMGAYVMYGGVWRLAIPYVKYAGTWRQAEPVVWHP